MVETKTQMLADIKISPRYPSHSVTRRQLEVIHSTEAMVVARASRSPARDRSRTTQVAIAAQTHPLSLFRSLTNAQNAAPLTST